MSASLLVLCFQTPALLSSPEPYALLFFGQEGGSFHGPNVFPLRRLPKRRKHFKSPSRHFPRKNHDQKTMGETVFLKKFLFEIFQRGPCWSGSIFSQKKLSFFCNRKTTIRSSMLCNFQHADHYHSFSFLHLSELRFFCLTL